MNAAVTAGAQLQPDTMEKPTFRKRASTLLKRLSSQCRAVAYMQHDTQEKSIPTWRVLCYAVWGENWLRMKNKVIIYS